MTGETLRLEHPDDDGAVTIHLPMNLDRFGPLLTQLASLGFEFPDVIAAKEEEARRPRRAES